MTAFMPVKKVCFQSIKQLVLKQIINFNIAYTEYNPVLNSKNMTNFFYVNSISLNELL